MRKVSVGFLAALISGAAFSQSTSSNRMPVLLRTRLHAAV